MALPGIPIWTTLAKRLGSRRGWLAAQIAFALTMVLMFIANDFSRGVLATSLLGLSLAGLLVYPDLLISDVIDEDEGVTGARREGMYFGINGFIIRFAFTLQGFTTAVILTATRYVSPTAGNLFPAQPDSAVLGMRLMVAAMPVLASVLAIWALQRYPLHGARLTEARRRAAALRGDALR